ncbi:MAG: hypothetical protein R2796_03790 [Chitinophagaceae bacterium]|nr:hypothetical protein [Chitinophagaceae bacterium]HQU56087.1 hypothetical protein [Chitinophagaceae bacterium]HQV06282.1 hypothetical protein [Chitinophagaceae bacterium]
MKNLKYFVILSIICYSLSSCGLLSRWFPRKTGCPTNGKNIGAERIISGDPKAAKAVKKAKKFKS